MTAAHDPARRGPSTPQPPSVAHQAVQRLREELTARDIDVRRLYDLHWDERLGSFAAFYTRPQDRTTYLLVLKDDLSAEACALWTAVREQQLAREQQQGQPPRQQVT